MLSQVPAPLLQGTSQRHLCPASTWKLKSSTLQVHFRLIHPLSKGLPPFNRMGSEMDRCSLQPHPYSNRAVRSVALMWQLLHLHPQATTSTLAVPRLYQARRRDSLSRTHLSTPMHPLSIQAQASLRILRTHPIISKAVSLETSTSLGLISPANLLKLSPSSVLMMTKKKSGRLNMVFQEPRHARSVLAAVLVKKTRMSILEGPRHWQRPLKLKLQLQQIKHTSLLKVKRTSSLSKMPRGFP